MECFIVNSLVS